MKAENISFRKVIQPLESGMLKERVKANGVIRQVSIRFYSGQEKSLRVRPFVLHKASRAEDFFTYVEGTDVFMSGDNDVFNFPITLDVEYDDQIAVSYENTSSAYPYSLVVDVQVVFNDIEVQDIG
jgi:hypothetical protein